MDGVCSCGLGQACVQGHVAVGWIMQLWMSYPDVGGGMQSR